MSALAAMEGARKCMWALHLEQQRGRANGRAHQQPRAVGASSDEGSDEDIDVARRQRRMGRAQGANAARREQRRQRRRAQAPAASPQQFASSRAVARVEVGVLKLVDLGLVPASWVGKVSEGHCFVGVRAFADPANENGLSYELVNNMR